MFFCYLLFAINYQNAFGSEYSNPLKIYKIGCNKNHANACNYVGVHYLHYSSHKFKSIKYFNKGCNLENPGSCDNLGVLYLNGKFEAFICVVNGIIRTVGTLSILSDV